MYAFKIAILLLNFIPFFRSTNKYFHSSHPPFLTDMNILGILVAKMLFEPVIL